MLSCLICCQHALEASQFTSLDGFKAGLGKFLEQYSDTPPVPGYTPINDNSLLSWRRTHTMCQLSRAWPDKLFKMYQMYISQSWYVEQNDGNRTRVLWVRATDANPYTTPETLNYDILDICSEDVILCICAYPTPDLSNDKFCRSCSTLLATSKQHTTCYRQAVQ